MHEFIEFYNNGSNEVNLNDMVARTIQMLTVMYLHLMMYS